MPVTRTYLCDDCGLEFRKFHMSRDEPAPDCPRCDEATRQIPGGFNITTHKAKAVDYAYKVAEEDYGLTNMRDNLREGDTIVKGPSQVQTSEAEQLTRELLAARPQLTEQQAQEAATFFKGSMSGATVAAPPTPDQSAAEAYRDQVLQMGMVATAAAGKDSVDPIGLIHEAGRAGKATTQFHVVAKSEGV